MESAGKQDISDDTSSEENDRGNKSVTPKRSYGCTFCKRGFTNAQALGGHMNIHRKDRAKAKQRPTSSVVPNVLSMNNEEYYMNPRYVPTISIHEPSKYYPILEAQNQRNYHMYIPTSPRVVTYGHFDCDLVVAPPTARSRSMSINEEILGANLSLQIGPTNVDENEIMLRKGIMKLEDEVDLELRLGHDP